MSTNTVAPVNSQRRVLQELLEGPKLKQAVAMALPKHLSPERFIRTALNATMRTPDLLLCTQESFFKCLLDLSAYGLEPDGRRAHLIPFNRKVKTPGKPDTWVKDVQLIIDYKGIAELVRRSGEVSYIHADVVYEGDEWSFGFGTDAHLKHKPKLTNRGKTRIAYYSFVRLKDGSEDFIVMSADAVEAVRQRSKSKDSGPWVTDYDEMGKKTAFRQHSKWLPFSSEIRDAIDQDTDDYHQGETIDLSASMKAASDINSSMEEDALAKLNQRLVEESSETTGEVVDTSQVAGMRSALNATLNHLSGSEGKPLHEVLAERAIDALSMSEVKPLTIEEMDRLDAIARAKEKEQEQQQTNRTSPLFPDQQPAAETKNTRGSSRRTFGE